MKKKWLVPAILIVLLAAGGFYYYRQRSTVAQRRASGPSQLATEKVKREVIESTLTGTASIIFSDRRNIQSTVSGTMAKVLVKDGATVKAGDLLAVIDNQTIIDDLEQARIDLDNLTLRLEGYRSVTAADKATTETKMQQAQEALENKRNDLLKLQVTSPGDGRVVSLSVRPNQTISSGQVLLSLSEDTSVLVVCQVQQQDIRYISVGQRAQVGFGSEIPFTFGEVISIGVEAVTGTKTTTVPVNVKIANPTGIYRTGLAANVTFALVGYNGEDIRVSGTAVVAPLLKYDVKAEVSGTIQAISVAQGDSVRSGQVLVELKNDALTRAVKYAENDLTVARQSYDRVQLGYAPGISDTDLKQAESQIRQAETKLRIKSDAAAALQIRSPIDGVILSHALDETASITAGNSLFVLADPTKMHMVVPVDELDVMQVKPGQKASITVDAIPGKTFSGTVTKIGSEGSVKDGIATYDVTVTVDLPQGLKGSMTGTAVIVIAHKENALVVPSEAVRSDGRRKVVSVIVNGSPVTTEITTGITGGKTTEILTGLKEGDSVVITSAAQQNQNQNRTPSIIPGIRR